MNIFAERSLRDYLDSVLDGIKQTIQSEARDSLLNLNEQDYVAYLTSTNTLEPVGIDRDKLKVTDREVLIPAEHFPSHRFSVQPGRRYPKQVLTFHLPFTGTVGLLKLQPSHRLAWTREVSVTGNEIQFDLVNFFDDASSLRTDAQNIIESIMTQAGHSRREVESFNQSLESHVARMVAARKEALLKQTDLLRDLGIPFKTRDDVPETFSIPVTRKKIEIKKPIPSPGPYSPDPTLDASTYDHILRLCLHVGTEMERHPSIYRDKNEETIRDHFIMVLSPHFHSVTGETFNRSGKTDILVRHEQKNAFVAECKFWGGEKGHFATIDQVLSYLTWRDSKASILYFVRNQNLQPVFDKIRDSTPNHPCFAEALPSPSEGWQNFRFRLPSDPSRNVFLAVLSFHFPDNSEAG